MPRHAYTADDTEQWMRRVQLGESFRAIAKSAAVDPRTVKIAVERFQAQHDAGHWQAVRHGLDTEAFRNHAQQVIALAEAVSAMVGLDPLSETGRLLKTEDPAKLAAGTTLLLNGELVGIRFAPDMREERRQLLLRDLAGHEPGIGQGLKQWSRELAHWVGHRQALEKALARRSLTALSGALADAAQQLLLQACRPTSAGQVTLTESMRREVERAVTSYHALRASADQIRDAVDRLALRGVLRGGCLVFTGSLP